MSLTADQMLAALDKWGIKYKFYKSDWRTHNRNAAQGWGPYYGHVVHNFGSDIPDPNSLAYLYNGDLARGMPGPLSQFSITDDGMLWIIGWGAANHTGYIEARLHQLVLADAAPLAADYRPSTNDSTGTKVVKPGPHYTGVEMTYGSAPTQAQIDTCELLSAALMDAVGYGAGSVIGHRECTTARSDPVGISMGGHRRAVAALLKAGPKGAAPTPVAPEEDFMSELSPTEQRNLYNRIMGGIPAGSAYKRTNADGSAARVLDSADGSSLRSILEGVAKKVGAPVDVDEAAIAAALAPQIGEAVKAAVEAGATTADAGAFADAVVARLGERLSPQA